MDVVSLYKYLGFFSIPDTGAVYTLTRGCDESNDKTEGCSSDLYFETCISVCDNASLCNNQNHTAIPHPDDGDGRYEYLLYKLMFRSFFVCWTLYELLGTYSNRSNKSFTLCRKTITILVQCIKI